MLLEISVVADVRLRAAGLDLQSRPIEYKDFQSAKAMSWPDMAPKAIKQQHLPNPTLRMFDTVPLVFISLGILIRIARKTPRLQYCITNVKR